MTLLQRKILKDPSETSETEIWTVYISIKTMNFEVWSKSHSPPTYFGETQAATLQTCPSVGIKNLKVWLTACAPFENCVHVYVCADMSNRTVMARMGSLIILCSETRREGGKCKESRWPGTRGSRSEGGTWAKETKQENERRKV